MKVILLHIFLLFVFITKAQQRSFTPKNTTVPEGTERRFALVIGNKDYTAIGALKNPINDALDISKAFQQLGFEVTTITNADYKKMLNVFNIFTKNLQKNDVVVFYYSGHGISYDGKNFLIPTDASITCLEEVEENALTLGRLMASVEAKNVKNSFVFLDACRNLPNLKQCNATKRNVIISKGLVHPTNNPSGSMTVYATREGDTADDNSNDRNGLFTSEFLKYINLPNLGLRQILDRTKKGVETRSNKRQSPARYDELSDDFVFLESEIIESVKKEEIVIPSKKSEIATPAKSTSDQLFMSMAFIKGGTFQMGDTRDEGASIERPVHQVSVSDFSMGKYEVTVSQFRDFIDATGHQTDAEKGDWSYIWDGSKWDKRAGINWRHDTEGKLRNPSEYNHPVIHVSWNDAIEFCEWLSKKENKNYRLPTDAEWEYAAGGGSDNRTRFGNGKDILKPNEANFNGNEDRKKDYSEVGEYRGETTRVGTFSSNRFGLFDMTGNVSEWCQNWHGTYTTDSQQNPTGASVGLFRVLRGGSWFDAPRFSRVAHRSFNTPDYRNNYFGFRVLSSQ